MSGGVTNCTGGCTVEVLTLTPDGAGVDMGGQFLTRVAALTVKDNLIYAGGGFPKRGRKTRQLSGALGSV
jgi:hypothetical protein